MAQSLGSHRHVIEQIIFITKLDGSYSLQRIVFAPGTRRRSPAEEEAYLDVGIILHTLFDFDGFFAHFIEFNEFYKIFSD